MDKDYYQGLPGKAGDKKTNMRTKAVPKQIKPNKMQNIFCPTKGCGELMVKVYPWASLTIANGIQPCNRCINKRLVTAKKLEAL